MRLLTFTCPLCGAAGQRFPLLSASRRQAKTACRGCGVVLRSDPRLGLYTLYLLYTQIIVMLAALPMIWAYASGRWFWLAAIWAVVLMLSWVPGAIRHARSPIVRAWRDPDYSYARRPGATTTRAAANPGQGSDVPGASQ
ncbi:MULTISPECIES: hypothetical protein [Stenotrophomonas]|uniref:DUF983 domain-containing protein n=1 Tax=Stenotrophomonas hibiscicola TaxID=86189 RepID=A0ABV0CAS4_9GAMM|nr:MULTISPECIES: hypothetical protein [Stenotrophomonas]ELK6801037.1 hypothetical protein [Stenotrophomonas maltophilia]MBA0263601.1 hypothetical protein [Stenotrophomonas maltophilia]MBA0328716.1 hypothetical protein [Stenotrophomonas maltophilia]MBA0468674.1 hypothetical protein [Stenotrophomonas maltophilia]MBA0475719.1 hypothetical protein [Stenotrophomonas maltophilia]